MITLTIKVKGESATFTKKEYISNENYPVCKANEDLQRLVEKAVKASQIEEINDVIINAKFEW